MKIRDRKLRYALSAAAGAATLLGALPVTAGEGGSQIEVIRGTRRESVSTGSRQLPRNDGQAVSRSGEQDPDSVAIEFDTDRYTIDGNQRADIRQDLRALLRIYDKVLGIRVSREFQVKLEVEGNRGRYEDRQGSELESAGFYRHDTRQTVVSGGHSRANTRETMIHETSHAILGDQFRNVPQWLNEGLAEYFESLQRISGRVQIPRDETRRQAVRDELAGSVGKALDRLIALAPEEWNSQQEADFRLSYDQAWSIVYMLMESSRSRDVLLQLLQSGSGSNAQAIENNYPRGLRGFAEDWRRWLASGGVPHSYY